MTPTRRALRRAFITRAIQRCGGAEERRMYSVDRVAEGPRDEPCVVHM